MTLESYRTAGILLLTLGAALPAAAQDQRKAEISAGYQMLAFKDTDVDETLGRGWYADVAGNIGPVFAAVFQVGGNYKTFEETETLWGVTSTVKATLKVHEFLGGVRVGPRHTTISPYAEFLIGGVNGSFDAGASVVGGGQTLFSTSSSDSATDLAMQIGGGVTVWLSKRVGIRGTVGYLRIMSEDEDANVLRAAGGISFGF